MPAGFVQVVTSPAQPLNLARPVVLVPTMGALHAGHVALLREGRRRAGSEGTLVASIFVNPLQFGPSEDFSRYPRPADADEAICRAEGVDVLFAPAPDAMYAPDRSVFVEETTLSRGLCGASRPGHFRGVCTVVLKLFHIVLPDIAVFGEKDYQQLAIVRRMVRDLNLRIEVAGVPIVREADGLALSSRNRYLSPEQRAQAPALRRALVAAAASGLSPAQVRQQVLDALAPLSEARVDYVEVVDPETLAPLAESQPEMLIAAAVYFGQTRLIDNIVTR